jgi:hypothetical protein
VVTEGVVVTEGIVVVETASGAQLQLEDPSLEFMGEP